MFKKKKLYKVTFRLLSTHTTIVDAKDECQAVSKVHRRNKTGVLCEIISVEEYNVARG